MNPALEAQLVAAATALGDLREDVVFVGGVITGLLVSDPGAPATRPTRDVDVIVPVDSQPAYHEVEQRLHDLGFHQDLSGEHPICRWFRGNVVIDVMPREARVLGFSNRWYQATFEHAETRILGSMQLRVADAVHFIATKLEAFGGRGGNDYTGSADMEDIIAVVDGRAELLDEVRSADDALRDYIRDAFARLLATPAFLDALPGHLGFDQASQARIGPLLDRLAALASR